jgi:hypothetical protein
MTNAPENYEAYVLPDDVEKLVSARCRSIDACHHQFYGDTFAKPVPLFASTDNIGVWLPALVDAIPLACDMQSCIASDSNTYRIPSFKTRELLSSSERITH